MMSNLKEIDFNDKFFNYDCLKNITYLSEYQRNNIKWMRPKDLIKNPKLGIEKTSYYDLKQGLLDDCCFISACASISKYPNILKKIFTRDQDLCGKNYNGYLELNLWLKNEWTTVIIDDQIPTIDKKLCFSRNRRESDFWVAILEKAFAKAHNGYENLISIDSAYVLICLTGGISLRFNPNNLNEKESIVNFLILSKQISSLIGIIGCEVIKSEKNDIKIKERTGHSFALLELINFNGNKEVYIKAYNSQERINIFFDKTNQQKNFKLTNIDIKGIEQGILVFSIDELIEFFEVLTIVLVNENQKAFKNEQICQLDNLKWKESSNLIQSDRKLAEIYLNSPHIVLEIKRKNNNKITELIKIVFNSIVENFEISDFISFFILPIKSIRGNLFINYTMHQQLLSNTNPYCEKLELLSGMYILVPLISSKNLPKSFSIRILCLGDNDKIIEHKNQLIINQSENSYYLNLTELSKQIKIVLSKCCVCESFLDINSHITIDSKVFCKQCYSVFYKCQRCDNEINACEYFTINQRVYCKFCIEKY